MNTTEAGAFSIGHNIDYTKDFSANVVFLICTVIMLIMGLVGNILVIGAVLVHKRLRVLSNVFVINLAVADLCVTIVVDSFGIVGIASEGTFFDDKRVLCDMVGVFCVTSCACSMWNIAHISFNRYVRICHHTVYPKIYNVQTVPFIVAGTWLICFCIDLPNLLGWGAHNFDARIMMCTYDYKESYTYTVFFVSLGFGVPLLVTSFSYVRIIFIVKRAESNARRSAEDDVQTVTGNVQWASSVKGTTNKRNKLRNTDIRLLRSVFTIWVVFTVMWSPYALTVLGDVYHVWSRNIYVVAVILAHTNSSINGILYAATNRHFREGYTYLILRCFRGRRVSPEMIDMDTTMAAKPSGRTSDEEKETL
ncbi:melatonin receptor type 1B-B-like [Asterias rubens]|uniref:melatonin receptor type 1B-B-like n=1 Tax=Asterias rubens TaxID=7604 RepID=UPI001455B49A|nr:melatonin receptor type 1B-B-like [Asterias rubens]